MSTQKHSSSTHLILIGCGSMGGALLRGWLRSNLSFHKITVISPRQNALPEEALKSDTVEWIAADDINGQKIKLSLLK